MSAPAYLVEKIVHGGQGLIREGGRAIFVPFTLPGEQVRIRLEPTKGQTLRAVVTEVAEASPDRVPPPCPLFGRCGGCQLQHASYPAQLRIKAAILAESLERICGAPIEVRPPAPAASPLNYRSRVRFQVKGNSAGFFAHGSNDLVKVESCLLASESVNRVLPLLSPLIRRERPQSIEVIARPEGEAVAVTAGGRNRTVFRARPLPERAGSFEWVPEPGLRIAFEQVNPERNTALRELVGSMAAAMSPEGVIELYAGSGNLTEVLPPGAWVQAADSDPQAVELARERLGEKPGLDFQRLRADQLLDRAREQGLRPGLILLDPPRAGAREAMPGIVALEPRHIIYVSCDPPTLARDAKMLIDAGYQIESVTAVDMFPQTAHVEAVALFIHD